MAQGKMKVKSKLPSNIKKNKQKGAAITKKKNCPVKSKKDKTEANKLKQVVTKTLNKAIEEDIRAKVQTNVKLSKAQEAVAKYHSSKTE